MQFKAFLLDLDDTLLANSMETFVPAYFRALTESLDDLVEPDTLIRELVQATRAMDDGDGRGLTNHEAFSAVFYPAVGQPRELLEPRLEAFYAEQFPKLRPLTRPRPEAQLLVEWSIAEGRQVVVATNPLFPRTAIEQRLEWAGLPIDEFSFDLVTYAENMHSTKARPAYYREILQRIDRVAEECLMVGDHWQWDVVHAVEVGIAAFWICEAGREPPCPEVPIEGHGTLARLWELARSDAL